MPTTKEVFALRKKGELNAAYDLAKQLFQENPTDEWTIKAISWVLYDQLKKALAERDVGAITQYSQELSNIPINKDNEILSDQVRRILTKAQPEGQEWQQAKELDNSGNHTEALVIFRLIRQAFEEDNNFADSYGWCLYKILKKHIENNYLNVAEAITLFREYLQLQVRRPSNLHSNMLRLMEKYADKEGFPFYHLFKIWGFDQFQPEDWEKNQWEGKLYAGLAEKCIQHAGKLLLKHGIGDDIKAFHPILDKLLERINDNIWLYYYKAKLLVKTGEKEHAEAFLRPVVKQKRTEYWAWALMAEVYSNVSKDKTIACYCRALLCPTEEIYLARTRLALAELLIKQEKYEEARTEIDTVVNFKQSQEQNVPENILSLQRQVWYQNTSAKENNRSFYQANKELAEEILFYDLPWLPANCGESYTRIDEPNIKRVKLYLKEKRMEEVNLKDKSYHITKRFRLGAPVQIKAERTNERWHVYLVEKREGEIWDCFPEYVAVIDHINKEKNIIHFIVNTRIEGIIRLTHTIENIQENKFIKVRLKSRLKDGKTIYEVVYWQLTELQPEPTTYRCFSGYLTIQRGKPFGFVDDIFVSANLLNEYGYTDAIQIHVKGNALINFDKKKGKWGWKAVSIEPYLDDSNPPKSSTTS